METAIEELQRRHPNLDRMMCETLLKLHEQGKLDKYAPRLDEKPVFYSNWWTRSGATLYGLRGSFGRGGCGSNPARTGWCM